MLRAAWIASVLAIVALVGAGCVGTVEMTVPLETQAEAIELPGIIRPIRLVAGRPTTLHVADLVGLDLAPRVRFDTSGTNLDFNHDAVAETITLSAPSDDHTRLALIRFAVGSDAGFAIPVEVWRPVTHTFRFQPDLSTPAAEMPAVHVIGAFNDWARGRDRLVDADGDGQFELTLPIEPGRYEYKFTVGEREVTDRMNPDSVLNPFGAYNNVLTVRPAGAAARLRAVGRRHDDASGTWIDLALAAEPSASTQFVALIDNRPAADVRVTAGHVQVRVPVVGEHVVRVAAAAGEAITPWVEVPIRSGRPRGDGADAPFTWNDAVVYQVVIDRFANGDPSNDAPVRHDSLAAEANYHGGDLQGLLERLPYLDSLGVNVIWLSPLYDNPEIAHREHPPPHRYYSGYHGYWPANPRSVEEHFGDMALLRRVVDESHARGIRVLLDFVAAHVHESHPYVAEHPEWFGELELPDGRLNLRLWDEHRLTTWFEPYLPRFDYDAAPAAVDQLFADADWWLTETGAEGFRHDAVKHISSTFWRTLTARLRRDGPARATPLYQVGETFGSHALVASYVGPGQLDAQFNFNLYDAAVAAFTTPSGSFDNLAAEVERGVSVYGPLHLMANVMDSHDKPRFLALVEGDLAVEDPAWGPDRPRVDDPASYRRAALYMAYLLTTPGVPVLYYGDEIGMTGANDPDNRRPMRWGADVRPIEQRLREEVRTLVGIRNDRPVLRIGAFETLHAGPDTWAYLRAMPGAGVIVALNKGRESAEIGIDLPPAYEFVRASDAVNPGQVPLIGGRLTIAVPAGGYRVIDVR